MRPQQSHWDRAEAVLGKTVIVFHADENESDRRAGDTMTGVVSEVSEKYDSRVWITMEHGSSMVVDDRTTITVVK